MQVLFLASWGGVPNRQEARAVMAGRPRYWLRLPPTKLALHELLSSTEGLSVGVFKSGSGIRDETLAARASASIPKPTQQKALGLHLRP